MAQTITIRTLIQRGEAMLVEHGVPNARRNAEWMLCDALGCSVLDLYTMTAAPPEGGAAVYWSHIRRRCAREPLQRILGSTEFMSLAFEVPGGVFVPRPDTEVLVERVEGFLRSCPVAEPLRLLDLGSGTGVIAVSLAVRIGNVEAWAVDSSREAVEATGRNAEILGVSSRVTVWHGDAAEFLSGDGGGPERFTAIACNPPYIETGELGELPPEVRDHEPTAALDGGADGLDAYRALVPLLAPRLLPGGLAMFEIGDAQGAAVSGMLAGEGFADIEVIQDYAGRDRVVAGRRQREGEGNHG
jgi:release factor glutamine methyltransferase